MIHSSPGIAPRWTSSRSEGKPYRLPAIHRGAKSTRPAYQMSCTLGEDSSQQGAYTMDINLLLDKAKKTCSISTDADLAKSLGVSKQALSGYRQGARLPDPVTCAALAGLTGEPLAKVLGIVGEARAISREEKSVWRALATSATMLLLVLACTLPQVHAQDEAQDAGNSSISRNTPHTAYYVKCGQGRTWLVHPESSKTRDRPLGQVHPVG